LKAEKNLCRLCAAHGFTNGGLPDVKENGFLNL